MPSFVILNEQKSAVLCSPNSLGAPDRKSALPIRANIRTNDIQIVGEDRPRKILSSFGGNGKIVYCVEGTTIHSQNKERRRSLSKALSQLDQLSATLRPLITASDNKLASEGLGLLYNWLNDERERLTEVQE
jgi:hypothetical protein